MTVVSINPTTGETLETFAETTPAALERVLDEAVAAYQTWRRCSYAHRAKLGREAARLLRERKSEPARTMALEMGKALPQGEAEAGDRKSVVEGKRGEVGGRRISRERKE